MKGIFKWAILRESRYSKGQHERFRGACSLAKPLWVKINKHFEHKSVNIFLPDIFNICFGCSKELSR